MSSGESPYNPLDRLRLAESVAEAMLQSDVLTMPLSDSFTGAGIYAIYYTGEFELYAPVTESNADGQFEWPIYVGKAIPAGARRGTATLTNYRGRALFRRLEEHARSIQQAENLDIADFVCRYLVVDDIWIPLAESLLIQNYSPVWNQCLDGFGNHDPGRGRYNQQRSPWDVLHPGREWAMRCAENRRSVEEITTAVEEFLAEQE